MSKVENNIDIYYAVGKANTLRKEYELITIIKNVTLHDESLSQQLQQK